jgi:membrane protein implicated in regulation of membrane protease activity
MNEPRGKLPGRSELGVIAGWLATATVLLVALLSDGAPRIAALVALALLVVCFLVGDFFLALADERASLRNPHDTRVSDIGRPVRVVEDFTRVPAGSAGRVSLAGETWNARSRDGTLYKAGEELVVVAIERLVLVVAPRERR